MSSGLIPDGQHFCSRAQDEASSWRATFKNPIPVESLASRLGSYVQAYTLYSSVRPFGISALIGGLDSSVEANVDGAVGLSSLRPLDAKSHAAGGSISGVPRLYMVEPSGLYWGYYGAATGKGRQIAKAELEKLNLAAGTLSVRDGVKEAARIMHIAHEDTKDKEFELEMTWVSTLDGPTRGLHEFVPDELIKEAEQRARKSLEGDLEDGDSSTNDKMES